MRPRKRSLIIVALALNKLLGLDKSQLFLVNLILDLVQLRQTLVCWVICCFKRIFNLSNFCLAALDGIWELRLHFFSPVEFGGVFIRYRLHLFIQLLLQLTLSTLCLL